MEGLQNVNCSQCNEAYDERQRLMRLLDCKHVFCEVCVTSMANCVKCQGPIGEVTELQRVFRNRLSACDVHGAPLKYLCVEEGQAICLRCIDSHPHCQVAHLKVSILASDLDQDGVWICRHCRNGTESSRYICHHCSRSSFEMLTKLSLQGRPTTHWICSECTLINYRQVSICECCGRRRNYGRSRLRYARRR
jgi:hypothetical protein